MRNVLFLILNCNHTIKDPQTLHLLLLSKIKNVNFCEHKKRNENCAFVSDILIWHGFAHYIFSILILIFNSKLYGMKEKYDICYINANEEIGRLESFWDLLNNVNCFWQIGRHKF